MLVLDNAPLGLETQNDRVCTSKFMEEKQIVLSNFLERTKKHFNSFEMKIFQLKLTLKAYIREFVVTEPCDILYLAVSKKNVEIY